MERLTGFVGQLFGIELNIVYITVYYSDDIDNSRFPMATQAMNDSWSRVVDQIKSIWGDQEFAEDEIKKARGSLPKMVVLIHEKTGEPKPDITMKIAAFL